MQPEAAKYLYDIKCAADLLGEFIAGITSEDYARQPMVRAAVERQFEIIGEALSQLAKRDQNSVNQITDYQRIIAFRNILIHGYAQVDDRLVWDVVETKLPRLREEVEELLWDA
jgi:uncharacterized protein with HEPN domain